MSEIEKLIKKIEKEIKKLKGIDEPEWKRQFRITEIIEYYELQAKLEGIKEGLEALKKDLIKNKPCPNKHPFISACYEQVIDDINNLLK